MSIYSEINGTKQKIHSNCILKHHIKRNSPQRGPFLSFCIRRNKLVPFAMDIDNLYLLIIFKMFAQLCYINIH